MPPPVAVNVVDLPVHMVALLPASAVGKAFTVTVTLSVDVHDAPLVTVTVYVVFNAGDTVMLAVVSVVLHAYVPPPEAVNVVDFPLHIVALVPASAVGTALTVTVTLSVDVQLDPLVTVTVYVLLVVGDTVVVAAVAPVLHAYVPPPVAVNVVDLPLHIVALVPASAVGTALTVTVTLSVDVQLDPLVTVTVYVVLDTGDTVIEAVVSAVLHE